MREITEYLDRLLAGAGLEPQEEQRLRGEMSAHLEDLVRDGMADGNSEEEAVRTALVTFGEIESLQDVWRTTQKEVGNDRRRWLPILKAACVVLFFGWTVNTFAYEVYLVSGHSVEPRLTQGSHVLVDKWNGSVDAGDIVAYREGERIFLGVVDGWDSPDRLLVHRNGFDRLVVEKHRLVGRVVCQIP